MRTLLVLVELYTSFSFNTQTLNSTLTGLRQVLATESPLQMMKNAFYFNLEAFFILQIFKFLS